jgi:hypothetical protein
VFHLGREDVSRVTRFPCAFAEVLHGTCAAGVVERNVQVISTPHVNLSRIVSHWLLARVGCATHWRPIKLKVSMAMRTDSVEPRIEGVPLHCAA